MRKIAVIFCFIIALVSCDNGSTKNVQETLTLGTFNIQWLGDGIEDHKNRTEQDIMEIADIISSASIDIMALQEIENKDAIERILKYLPDYTAYVSNLSYKQNVGVIYKKYIDLNITDEYKPLMLNGISRPGLVFNAKIGSYEFDGMVVHLKSTSRYDSTAQMKDESREMRKKQAELISHWADSLMGQCGKMELVILGDFNDFPKRKNNATLTSIIHNPNLIFLTGEERSCYNPLWFGIDHIVVSSTTKKRFKKGSIFVYNFHSTLTEKEAENVSDHCPITLQLKIDK